MKMFALCVVVASMGCAVSSSDPVASESSDLQVSPNRPRISVQIPHDTCFFQDQYVLDTFPTNSCADVIPNNVVSSAFPGSEVEDPYGEATLKLNHDSCHLIKTQEVPAEYCGVRDTFECGKLDAVGNWHSWTYTTLVYYNRDGSGSGLAFSEYDPITNRSDCLFSIKVSLLPGT